ncbi:MAG: 2-oxo acid dehydrogenase subunit E2, partial [Chthonomonadales bacterium]
GAYGIDNFDPIIVPPQACILGVCRIKVRPAVVNGQIVPRSLMNLCLSFDHRVVDGAPAAEFLARVVKLLESPILAIL